MDQTVMRALSQDDPPSLDVLAQELWRIINAIVGAD
jgi:hypothetical protein